MAIKIGREDTKDFKVTVIEGIEPHEPTIYDLAFLHIELRWIREYGLNELELLVFSFINSYKPSTGKIYFSNAQLGKMFNKSEQTISRCINSLREKKMVDVELQTGIYGGTIRYLTPRILHNSDYSKMTRGVVKNEEGGSQKRLPNSNINSNINISNDRVKPIYGNKDLIALKEVIIKNYPKPLDGITDTRKLQNLKQVCSKRKNQDEWMDDNWKENFKKFFSLYLDITKEEYLVNSLDKLREKAKLWREYRGKLN